MGTIIIIEQLYSQYDLMMPLLNRYGFNLV